MSSQSSFYTRAEAQRSDMPPSSVPPASSVLKETVPTVTSPRRIKIVFGVWGTLLMMFFMIIPAWSALDLMEDPIFSFFVGRRYALMLLAACAGGVVLYASTVNIFLRMARPDVKTEQSMFMIFVLVLSAMGLAFMLVSLPMLRKSEIAYDQLFNQCTTGSLTRGLHEYAEILHAIRARPNCTGRLSVEECSLFYEMEPYTTLLKEMENNFRCSGFGYQNVTVDLSDLIARANDTAEPSVRDAITSAVEAAAAETTQESSKEPEVVKAVDAVEATTNNTVNTPNASETALMSGATTGHDEAKLPRERRPPVHSKLVSRSLQLLAVAKREAQVQPEVQPEARESDSKRRRQKAGPAAVDPDLFLLSVNNTLLKKASGTQKESSAKRLMHRVGDGGKEAQRASGVSEHLSASGAASRQNEYTPGLYPQALFTDASYQTSCDGQSARQMRYLGMETAKNTYNMGICLLVGSVVLGFAEFFSFCTPRKRVPV